MPLASRVQKDLNFLFPVEMFNDDVLDLRIDGRNIYRWFKQHESLGRIVIPVAITPTAFIHVCPGQKVIELKPCVLGKILHNGLDGKIVFIVKFYNLPIASSLPKSLFAKDSVTVIEYTSATVALLAKLPLEQAVALLRQLSQDPDSAVRVQVAQTAAQLKNRRGGKQSAAALLGALISDSDAGVRAQAAALLAKLLRRSARPAESSSKTAEKPTRESRNKAVSAPTTNDLGPPRDADNQAIPPSVAPVAKPGWGRAGDCRARGCRPASRGQTTPRLPADQRAAELEFQIDKQPPQTVTGKAIEVAVGEHHITHFGGQHDVTVGADETVPVNLTASAAADFVRAGMGWI